MNIIIKIYEVKSTKLCQVDGYPLFTFLNMAASVETNTRIYTISFPGISGCTCKQPDDGSEADKLIEDPKTELENENDTDISMKIFSDH